MKSVCLLLMQPPHIPVLVRCLCVEIEGGKQGRGLYKEKDKQRETEWETGFSLRKQKETKTETDTVRRRKTEAENGRDREGCCMCVLHPKGSLTQYIHDTGGQSTTRVHWPKSLLFIHTHNPSKQYSCKHPSTENNPTD